jgi:lipid II:glycine glycyltransferase (peptidoglycan interpeptide bridge formation enzyme)
MQDAAMQDAADSQHLKEARTWQAWDAFLETQTQTGFRQSSFYAANKLRHDGTPHFATVLRDGDAIVGGAVVFKRSVAPDQCYYYIPEGPVLLENDSAEDQSQVFRSVMAFVERKRREETQVVSHLCLNPRWEHIPDFVQGFQASSYYYGLPRNTQCVDLTLSESALLAQMQQKGRYNIRVAQRHGVSVVEDASPQGITDFIDMYNETFDRKKLRTSSPGYFYSLLSALAAPEHGSIFFAEYEGIRLATALMVYFGHRATYYFGASRSVHRNVMAPYLLHYEMMRLARARGCQSYDFFGVTPQGASPDSWTEISIFKRKFGGQEIHHVPTLDFVYDASAYERWLAQERARRAERRRRRADTVETAEVGG